ncbi:aminotransferase class I/II-fold pyridoxal phosphate-dependent enzyme [archaeon]|nr:MAG: aminotransferase class I/II-fold pyridoxal phosphate-dependent enzyme [archaeon]
MCEDINNAPDGSVFMLHACSHNPTGCDPSHSQWDELSGLMKKKKHVVFFDSAYQV